LFIEVDGELKQISAAGYNVGPGHGIIVSKINDNIRVDEAADRVWYKKFNPWLPRGKKTSMNPHRSMKRREECGICGEIV